MEEAGLAETLAEAGLRFCGLHEESGTLPVRAAWLIVSCSRQDGRRDLTVDKGDPQLLAKANAAWFQLASESGLLESKEQELLLGVNFASDESTPALRWVRVKLMTKWDVMGAGAASGPLGSGVGYPEFVMMSLDEKTVLRATTWDQSIGLLAVPNPDRVQMIRSYTERLAANPRTESGERAAAEAWLARHPENS